MNLPKDPNRPRWFNSRLFIVLSTLSILICVIVIMGWNEKMSAKKQKRPLMGANGELVTQTDSVSLTLTWDANPEPDIIGYKLCYGNVPGVYTNCIDVTSTTVSLTLSPGSYFFAVKARNAAGLEGPFSTEVPYSIVSATPTPSPTATATATATATPTATASATSTATAAATSTPTVSATATATATATPTATAPVSTPTPSPNFTIMVTPQTLVANPDGGYLVYSINIVKSGGFTSPIILSANGLPDGVAMRFNPNPSPLFGSNFVIFCGFIPPGSYPFTVVGQSFSVPPITRTAPGMLFKPIPTATP